MCKFNMFITAVCVLFLIKLRWPKNKSIYDKVVIIIIIIIFIIIVIQVYKRYDGANKMQIEQH